MDESNANHGPKHRARLGRRLMDASRRLRKWLGSHGQDLQIQFLQGAANRLGSGAVTLIILWWETHR
ncbi:hypothetical protein ACKI16_30550 [Streptomyces scabiei]|uniref:hypothetical protein n=1 Tax=Streptomyces scabiei TaxID=1930 RepID=UPI0038F7C45F